MRYNAFEIVERLETEIAQYTGAPLCVAVHSCTDAIGICLEYQLKEFGPLLTQAIELPKLTYIGVPMQVKRAGYKIEFTDQDWEGEYRIWPYNIWDSARRFRHHMWFENGPTKCYDVMDAKYKCLSFHRTKILGHSQGGAIIHNDAGFQHYAQRMRFDGRAPGVNLHGFQPTVLGRHCYMDPEVAAGLLHNLMYLPDYNPDLPKSAYPDLSQMDIFK